MHKATHRPIASLLILWTLSLSLHPPQARGAEGCAALFETESTALLPTPPYRSLTPNLKATELASLDGARVAIRLNLPASVAEPVSDLYLAMRMKPDLDIGIYRKDESAVLLMSHLVDVQERPGALTEIKKHFTVVEYRADQRVRDIEGVLSRITSLKEQIPDDYKRKARSDNWNMLFFVSRFPGAIIAAFCAGLCATGQLSAPTSLLPSAAALALSVLGYRGTKVFSSRMEKRIETGTKAARELQLSLINAQVAFQEEVRKIAREAPYVVLSIPASHKPWAQEALKTLGFMDLTPMIEAYQRSY